MASEFSKLLKDAKKHAVAGSSKLKATTTGHIYNIKATADIDNGCIVKKGDYIAPDYYAEAAASGSFAGKIIDKAANGNWYIEVTACDGDCLVLTVPLIYENYTKSLEHESNFYNEKDSLMRCYELYVGDVFELSAEGFSGTPEAKKTVSVEDKKIKVAEE